MKRSSHGTEVPATKLGRAVTEFVRNTEKPSQNAATLGDFAMTNKFVLGLISTTALVIGTSAGVNAAEPRGAVPQLAAITTDLGHNTSALTYWVDEADGIHVVTTIDTAVGDETAPEHGRDAVVRFSALILPGQSQVISVPGPTGSQTQVLRIRRLGNHFNAVDIEIDRIALPTMAAESARTTN